MSPTSTESVAERVRQWRLAEIRAVCDVIEPWDEGLLLRATPYPTYFVFNAVLVDRPSVLGAEGLREVADRHLEGLGHRCLEFVQAEYGLPFRPAFERWGWKSALHVWMRFEGPRPPASDDTEVEEVDYAEVLDLRRRWHEEDFPGVHIGDHFTHAAEAAACRAPRVLSVRAGGEPVAYAQVERLEDAAEVTEVYVHPDHRGRGLGTRLTRAAVALAPPVPDLWIQADAEDRPQRLYARLGFQPVARDLKFLRLPGSGGR